MSDVTLAFQTKRFALMAQLEKAVTVLPSKDILPVLKNFEVAAADGRLRVVATDTQLSVVADTTLVTIETEGRAVLPGKQLLDIVKAAEDGDLTITVTEDRQAQIAVGRASWTLMLVDPADYPPIPDMAAVPFHKVDRAKFVDAIDMVRKAACVSTTRSNLMMVNVTAEGLMRAADGARYQQVTLADWPGIAMDIPIGAVDQLLRVLRSSPAVELEVGETDEYLCFRVAGDTFISAKLAQSFPNVEAQLLRPAQANTEELVVDRGDLLAAVKRVRVTADPETNAVLLRLTPGKCEVVSRDKRGSHATEVLDVAWSSPDRDVAVNHEHLTDLVTMVPGEAVHILLGPDTKTRKSLLKAVAEEAGVMGLLNQMRAEVVGA